jgi:enoyl-CoA hydratase
VAEQQRPAAAAGQPGAGAGVLIVTRTGDGVVVLTLNRPDRRNAISSELAAGLCRVLGELASDSSARVVVLTGAGGAFCAGLDLKELGDSGTNFSGRFVEFARDLPQPTIAAIDGPAVTGGLELALACDIRIASAAARLADTHVRVGVLPGSGASILLPRLIGYGRAMEMSLSGRSVGAAEAERWGLVNRVVDTDALGAALGLARQIAANDPAAVTGIKQLIRDGADRGVADALVRERDAAARYFETFDHRAVAATRGAIMQRAREESAAAARPPG